MGSCCSKTEYVTPRPSSVLPDPAGACTFSVSRNAFRSSNYNVFKGADDDALLWLFLRVKGNPNGVNDSYFVLENFWRPPFSEEGDVLCWCHFPAFQRNKSYTSSGLEECGTSPDLNSEIHWFDSQFEKPDLTSMVLWKRKEWQFNIRIGFYRDRYMEEPLGVLEIFSTGWIIETMGDPGKGSVQPMKEVKHVQYVYTDQHGLHFPIDVGMVQGSSKIPSYDCCMFGCLVTPGYNWVSDNKLIVSSSAGHDPALALLIAFLCANIISPEDISSCLNVSQIYQKTTE